jgi:membrane protease YdiL (CAAX protease family)
MEERSPTSAEATGAARARPAAAVVVYARPAGALASDRLIPSLSRRIALIDIAVVGGLFVFLQVAKEVVMVIVLKDAPAEVYRAWAPGLIVGLGVLLAFVVLSVSRREGLPPGSMGLTGRGWLLEAGIGLLGAAVVMVGIVGVSTYVQIFLPYLVPMLQQSQESISEALPPMSIGTVVALTVVVAIYEELLFRGFLLPRLRVLTGSWWSAILLGATGFGLLHMYQAAPAAVMIMGLAVFLSVLFVWRGSLIAPMVTHFVIDAIQLAALQMLNEANG